MKLLRVMSEHGPTLLRMDLVLFAHEEVHPAHGAGTLVHYEGTQCWIAMPFEDCLRYWEKHSIVTHLK